MKRVVAVLLVSILLSAGLLTGCETQLNKKEAPVADIVGSSHKAADVMIQGAAGQLDPEKPLLAASFVNIDDLDRSSSFGRIVSEQVASRFSEKGYQVIEMLLRNNVYIKQRQGEFLLSRELRNISTQHNAQAVIVGTYAVGRKNIFITSKLIRATDNVVLSTYDYTLPVDVDVASLLRAK